MDWGPQRTRGANGDAICTLAAGGTTRILWSTKIEKGEGRIAFDEARLFVVLLVYTEALY